MEELLQGYPSIVQLPVVWSEMDAFQHVNNVVFLRYAETGRIDYLQDLAFMDPFEHPGSPIGPILGEIHCKYKAPLNYPDRVTVATCIDLDTLQEDRFWMQQIIVSHKIQRTVAEVKAKIVAYDYKELGKSPIPSDVKERILAKEGQSN